MLSFKVNYSFKYNYFQIGNNVSIEKRNLKYLDS